VDRLFAGAAPRLAGASNVQGWRRSFRVAVDDPEGPTQSKAILVTGGFVGVVVVFVVQAQLSGTAPAVEQSFGIIVGMAVMLGLWWWARSR
jgi:protein-S-isoprenylcysteine O-methyltransferase Ste14